MRMVVVLPEPFGPRKPTISPSATVHRDVVDDGLGAEALDEVVDFDGVHGGARDAAYPLAFFFLVDIDDLPGLQRRGLALGPRLDQIDQLLPGLQRIDHRRREFRVGRDVADARGQPGLAAVAMDVEQ